MTVTHARAASPLSRRLSHFDVLAIALPITLSNATAPLVGFADTLVVGQLGSPALIGGVAVGATIFNFVYWGLGFLRMATTGLTAQAAGAGDAVEVGAALGRALCFAALAGLSIVLAQSLVLSGALWLIGGSHDVQEAARTYFNWRVWAAPAGLANFALLGWFIGLGRASIAFALQLFLNAVNVGLAVFFVVFLSWGVSGVGAAALIAEFLGAAFGLAVARSELRARGVTIAFERVLDRAGALRTFAVSGDITIRTLCVLVATVLFTEEGAKFGDVTLAANAVLNSIAMVSVYLLDGFAFSAEVLVGQAVGEGTQARFFRAVSLSTVWAAALGLVLTAIIYFSGPAIINYMTASPEVRSTASEYLIWAALVPVVGVWCFQLDGIFIGATRTADMRNMMLLSMTVYVVAWLVLKPLLGNHGLWLALLIFYVIRAVTLMVRLPALQRVAFAKA